MTTIRNDLTPAQRATPLQHTIDPGFVHYRKIQTIVGQQGIEMIDHAIRQLPELPEWVKKVRIDHIYTHMFLLFCNKIGVPPLEDLLLIRKGRLFCSTESLAPCIGDIFHAERVKSQWIPRREYPQRIEFHYSTRFIQADTLRARLQEGEVVSIVAELKRQEMDVLIFEPIIMGFPRLESQDSPPDFAIDWFGYDFFENFIEDFDEFTQVRNVTLPENPEPMKYISEAGFKACLAEILGDTKFKDWGGETSDFYSAHLTLGGNRMTGAFLLKGPAKFKPMNLNHLGKNNDQIARLSHEPANVLFVQHCHDILSPVRETLRAFAVQPSRPRRYCLIDGRDSLRLLYAYNLYDKAKRIHK